MNIEIKAVNREAWVYEFDLIARSFTESPPHPQEHKSRCLNTKAEAKQEECRALIVRTLWLTIFSVTSGLSKVISSFLTIKISGVHWKGSLGIWLLYNCLFGVINTLLSLLANFSINSTFGGHYFYFSILYLLTRDFNPT